MFEISNMRRKTTRQRMISLMVASVISFSQAVPGYAAMSNTVTVAGTYNGASFQSQDTVSVDLIDAAPEMLVTKTATLNDDDSSGGISDGDTIDFIITLENAGNVSISSIVLDDEFEQGSTSIALTSGPGTTPVSGDDVEVGVLNVDEVWTYEASYTVQQSNIDDGNDFVNTASFTGQTPDGEVTGEADVVIAVSTASEIELVKTPITTSYARAGDIVEWQINVNNIGGTTLTDITVTDNYADTLSCTISSDETIATLAPGGGEVCTATYEIQPSDLDNATLTNTASVTGTGGGFPVEAEGSAEIPREDANLVTVKTLTSGNDDTIVGETVTYEIQITNDGTADATAVTLTDILPAGLTATANNGSVTDGTYDPTTGLWSIATLANGASATLTLEGTVNAGQGGEVIANTVSAAESAENDPSTDGDTLTAIFTPLALPIIAVDDTVVDPIDGAFAVPGVINVFTGDTLGGAPVDQSNVTVSPVGTWPSDFTLNPDGSIDVASGTPSGIYVFDYEICEIADPDNCSIATVTIPVDSSIPRLAGTVFEDNNQNGSLDASDTPAAGYIVQLVQDGVVVETTTSDSNGEYEFTGFEPGTYDVVFIDPITNVGVGYIPGVVVGEDETILDQDLPIDPSGVVYNSLSGTPIAGATLTLVDGSGTPLPPACLLPNQQNQVSGADGEYRFDIVAGADAACPVGSTEYSIEITPPTGYLPLPSNIIPPQAGILDPSVCALDAIPGGACNLHVDNEAPPVATPSPYYLDFLIGSGDPDVIYNHIPIDPVPSPSTSGLTITKTAGVTSARLGDTIGYTITLTNTFANPYSGINIVDTLPAGTLYSPNSALVDGVANEPASDGRVLTFSNITVPGNGSVEITFSVRLGQQLSASAITNIVYATDSSGNQLTNVARATVRIEVEPVFSCSTIIGRVYDDLNRNGYPDDGEPGLAGVRVNTVNGLQITTDQYGRYSIPCADLPDVDIGSNFILKLDDRTLPTGYRITSENPRVVRVTAGKMTSLNFGAAISRVVRIDLSSSAFQRGSVKPSTALDDGIDRLVSALETEASVLRLTYYDEGEGTDLARKRLAEVEKLVKQRLRRSRIGVDLWIETKILKR